MTRSAKRAAEPSRVRSVVAALVGGPPPRASALVVTVLIALAGVAVNATDSPEVALGPGLLAALLAPLWLTTTAWVSLDAVLALATAHIQPSSPLRAATAFAVVFVGSLLAGVIVSMAAGQVASIQSLVLRQAHAREELERAAQEREKELQRQLSYASDHDQLTGTRTRQSMLATLDEQIAKRADANVLVLSLVGFADVNETLGPVIGDQALVEVGRRLTSAARDIDLVARLGGDEFAVLLPHLAAGPALALANQLQKALNEPVVIDGHMVPLSSRAGLACAADNGLVASELVARAEQTARSAVPGAAVAMWEGERASNGATRIERETDMRRGLAADEFFLLYQPLVSTTTGGLHAVEALVRWRHPQRGLVPPDDFITFAERTGLIVPLGLTVLEKACAQLREWAANGAGMHLTVAVNVSARQLLETDFVVKVRQTLWNSGVNPRQIVLELTESMLVDDNTAAINVLWQLRALGVRLAIDDFGTGYSSLARLGDMPVDELKIDKSFVDRLGASSHDSTALVTAAVAMGHGLALEVVAEGVETAEQAGFLGSIGCDLLQGYLLGKPQEPEAITARLGQQLMTPIPALPGPRATSPGPVAAQQPPPAPPPVPEVVVPKVAPR